MLEGLAKANCETWVPLGPHRLGSWSSLTSEYGLLEDSRPVSRPAQPNMWARRREDSCYARQGSPDGLRQLG
jgi:hypothetical protein